MQKGDIYGYRLYLQPQIQLDCGKLSGAEVLIRGVKESGELILPDKFIPKMEQTKQISKIDFFVMNQVCSLLKKWRDTRKVKFPLAVNFSRHTLSNPDALGKVLDLCHQAQVNPAEIIVEITERDTEKAGKVLTQYTEKWMKAGFSFSLDDYGTGFSNMKTLSEVAFSELKIDQSLITQLNQSRKAQVIVKSLVEMCQNIGGIRCIAEGIERESQVRFLREIGCEYGQGYYFYRPMSVNKFERMFL